MIDQDPQPPLDLVIGNYGLYALTLIFWMFTLMYGFLFRWYANEVGRVMFPAFVLMGLVLTQTSLSVFTLTNYYFRNPVRIGLYWGGAVMMLAMVLILFWLLRKKRHIRDALRAGKNPCPNAKDEE